jgi:DNA processing protein
MNNTEFLLLLQYALLGSKAFRLVHSFLSSGGTVDEIRRMPPEEFRGRFQDSLERILAEGCQVANPEEEIELAKKQSIRIVTYEDEDYPLGLKEITDPPLAFYLKGELSGPEELRLAMVGTRRPTYYGTETAFRFAKGLASAGLVIVSGLARGIDSYSHRGALEEKGKTYGVLGSGLLVPYPAENRNLMEKIVKEGGALVSELPLAAQPRAYHFPLRNRIISGLSRAVCVVEASETSGSLITAGLALEEGKEVYAIPGMIHSLTSQGTLKLIQEGAKLVRKPQDILEDYLPRLEMALTEAQQLFLETLHPK